MKKVLDPDELLEQAASAPLREDDEGLLLRAESAALARYHRWRALADRADGRKDERVAAPQDADATEVDRAQSGKAPPH